MPQIGLQKPEIYALSHIRLFQERLSQKCKSVGDKVERYYGQYCEAEAEGKKGKEGKTQARVFMRFLPETLLTLIKEHQTITTHNANRQCRVLFYACMRKPLPKRLYMQTLPTRYLNVRELGTGSLGTERWELHLLHSTVHPKLGERPFRRFSVRGSSSLAAVLEWKNHFIVCTDH